MKTPQSRLVAGVSLVTIGIVGFSLIFPFFIGHRGGQLRGLEVTNAFPRAVAVDLGGKRLADRIEPGRAHLSSRRVHRTRRLILTVLDPATGKTLGRLDLRGPALARIDDGKTIRAVLGP